MFTNELFGVISILLVFATYGPYLLQTIRNELSPHPYSWLLWTSITIIAYAAQLSDHAGPGSWMNGFTILLCIAIIAFAFKRGQHHITRFDTYLLIATSCAIPLWIMTKNPLASVVLVCAINTIAFYPTFRKSYHQPESEALYLYGINVLRHSLAILALANYSWATVLFSVTIALNNGFFALFLMWRQWVLARKT